MQLFEFFGHAREAMRRIVARGNRERSTIAAADGSEFDHRITGPDGKRARHFAPCRQFRVAEQPRANFLHLVAKTLREARAL
ncbi:hypothetical protein D3C87_1998700 [compost metagenome]